MMMMMVVLMMMMMMMMMMMRCPSSLRYGAKPRHLPYIYIYEHDIHIFYMYMYKYIYIWINSVIYLSNMQIGMISSYMYPSPFHGGVHHFPHCFGMTIN